MKLPNTSSLSSGIIVGMALAMSPMPAFAGGSVGTYQCNDCSLAPGAAGVEENYVIRTEVNLDVETWLDGEGQGKSVTLCNGNVCAVYHYQLGGYWLTTGP